MSSEALAPLRLQEQEREQAMLLALQLLHQIHFLHLLDSPLRRLQHQSPLLEHMTLSGSTSRLHLLLLP
jgi:hypothetical protein